MRTTLRDAASAAIAGVAIAIVVDVVLQFLSSSIRLSGGVTPPWWARAAAHGDRSVRLETNAALTEAITLYRSEGYVEVPAFNEEPFAHHWFEKMLP